MFYVLEHIFLCLLIAGLLGGLIGWLIRGMGFGSRLADLESDWRRRLGLLEDDHSLIAAKLKTSEGAVADWRTRFAALDTEHGNLKTSFADISAKVPVLEAAAAGWAAKSSVWDSARMKLEADLKACADARSQLEIQLADWSTKAKTWDTERADIAARLKTAEASLQKSATDHQAAVAGYEKNLADLRSELPVLRGQVKSVQAERDQLRSSLDKLTADHKAAIVAHEQTISGLRAEVTTQLTGLHKTSADHTAAVAEIATLVGSVKLLQGERDRERAAREKAAADQIAADARIATLLAQVKTVEGERDKAVHDFRGSNASFETVIHGLRTEIDSMKAQLTSAAADRTVADARIATLLAQVKTVEGERDKAVHDFRGSNASFETVNHGLRTEIVSMKAQLTSSHEERDRLRAGYESTIAGLKTASDTTASGLQSEMAALQGQLRTIQNERDHALSTVEALEKHAEELRYRISVLDSEAGDWKSRFAEIEARQAAPLAMAAAAGAAQSAPDPRYGQLQDRFHNFVVRTQKEGYGDIERIEGIGPVYGQKLRSIGIYWVKDLLEEGASAAGRQRITEESGIEHDSILTWVNHSDLLRIEGVTPDWAELLEVSGVDTVKELRNRNPENLQKKMEETNPTNPQGHYAPTVPDLDTVRKWIDIARNLAPKITY